MKVGAVVLLSLIQADGKAKLRPAVALRQLPGFGDWLVCGVSTQLQQWVAGFDEKISTGDLDFLLGGLSHPSLIRQSLPPLSPLLITFHIANRFNPKPGFRRSWRNTQIRMCSSHMSYKKW
jgi:hypothetical protein